MSTHTQNETLRVNPEKCNEFAIIWMCSKSRQTGITIGITVCIMTSFNKAIGRHRRNVDIEIKLCRYKKSDDATALNNLY
jgi:hypothetical protein